MTNRQDGRLYNAAKKLADCWYDNIGPAPKKDWFDGHEETEQALVRFGRFVNNLEGKNFYYTNPLDANAPRTSWHSCPCCVDNIPRTLLMLPTWMYAKSADSIYVNLFIGSTVTVDNVAGTDVQMIQSTDYPWKGNVSITVNPKERKNFSNQALSPETALNTEWKADLLDGVMVIKGAFANGSALLAIPNYARYNRMPPEVESPPPPGANGRPAPRPPASIVWIKEQK